MNRPRLRLPWVRRARLERAVRDLTEAIVAVQKANGRADDAEAYLVAAALHRGGRLRIPETTLARARLAFELDVRLDKRPPTRHVVIAANVKGTAPVVAQLAADDRERGRP